MKIRRDNRFHCILSCGSLTIRVSGDLAVHEILKRSARLCAYTIPAFRFLEDETRCPGEELLHLTLGWGGSARLTRSCPKVLNLGGDLSLLDPDTVSDLLVWAFAQIAQRRGRFLVDGSAALVNGELTLVTAADESERSAAAFSLKGNGCLLLSTNRCLIDKQMRVLGGTAEKTGAHRARPEDGGSPQFRVEPTRIAKVVHFRTGESDSPPQPIVKQHRKLVASSNVVSRLVCRPAPVAPWRLFLPPFREPDADEQRHEAILNLGDLPHFSICCRAEELVGLLREAAAE